MLHVSDLIWKVQHSRVCCQRLVLLKREDCLLSVSNLRTVKLPSSLPTPRSAQTRSPPAFRYKVGTPDYSVGCACISPRITNTLATLITGRCLNYLYLSRQNCLSVYLYIHMLLCLFLRVVSDMSYMQISHAFQTELKTNRSHWFVVLMHNCFPPLGPFSYNSPRLSCR